MRDNIDYGKQSVRSKTFDIQEAQNNSVQYSSNLQKRKFGRN